MKTSNNAVIFFHKNILKLYDIKWIKQCVESIINQKDVKFDILEINYGNEDYSIFEEYKKKFNSGYYFFKENFETHTDAMTFLLNKGFYEYEYDIIFNTNLDDFYNEYRFIKQIECINSGYLLCSSWWTYIKNTNGIDSFYKKIDNLIFKLKICNKYIDVLSIKEQIIKNHNVINHSGVCFSKLFWKSYDKFNNLLRYRDDKPYEDMTLWKRALENNIPVTIINDNLITYRLHNNQIGSNKNNKNNKNQNLDSGFKKNPNNESRRIGIFTYIDTNQISNIKNYLLKLNNILPDYRKILFIITNNYDLINLEFLKQDLEYHIKEGKYDIKSINLFYPKIETQCDLIYFITLDIGLLINNIYNNFITNDIDKHLIKVIIDSNNYFIGGLITNFIQIINNNLSLNNYILNNPNKIKIIYEEIINLNKNIIKSSSVEQNIINNDFFKINLEKHNKQQLKKENKKKEKLLLEREKRKNKK